MLTEHPTGTICSETGQPVYEVRLIQRNAAGEVAIDDRRITCRMSGCSIHSD